LGPVGCKIQVGAGNQTVKPRSAATTGKTAGDDVTVAKQRKDGNSVSRPDENRIVRDVKIHYNRPSDAAGVNHVVVIKGVILDSGAMPDMLVGFRYVKSLFPGFNTAAKWQQLMAEKPWNAKIASVRGIGGSEATVVIPKTPNLTVEIKLKVGQKGHQVDEWRGGPAELHITAPPQNGAKGHALIGIDFLRDHHVLLK